MNTIYRIYLNNYQGEDSFELYHKKENALARYQELMEEGKICQEFCKEDSSFSFFDAEFNEYSTFIYFDECELNSLFFD